MRDYGVFRRVCPTCQKRDIEEQKRRAAAMDEKRVQKLGKAAFRRAYYGSRWRAWLACLRELFCG